MRELYVVLIEHPTESGENIVASPPLPGRWARRVSRHMRLRGHRPELVPVHTCAEQSISEKQREEASRRDAEFYELYQQLSEQGDCDSPGGAEFSRVYSEWVQHGMPTPASAFIIVRANVSWDGSTPAPGTPEWDAAIARYVQ